MTRIWPLILAVLFVSRALYCQSEISPPVLITQVAPQFDGDANQPSLVDPVRVDLVIDQSGVPFSVESPAFLPDNVVRALMQYRFKPAMSNGKAVSYKEVVAIPVRRSFAHLPARLPSTTGVLQNRRLTR